MVTTNSSVLMVPFGLLVFFCLFIFQPAIYQPTRATICTILANLYNTYFHTTRHFPKKKKSQVLFVPHNNNDHRLKHLLHLSLDYKVSLRRDE